MSRKLIYVGIAVSLIAAFIMKDKLFLFFDANKKSINKSEVYFNFNAKIGLEGLAEQLSEQLLIDDIEAFISVGEYKGLDSSKLASGRYLIQSGTSYKNLLNGFTKNANGNGNAEIEVNVTFNNCRDIEDLAGKVASSLMFDSTTLINYIYSSETLNKYGFTKAQIPALFIPNTYKMFYDTDEKQFVDRMAKEFKNFWTEERKSLLSKVGLSSPSQAVTLASIVYSEQSRNKEEWPIIAGLYLNRIKKGIRLQSDPTFKYCWGDELNGVQRLLAKHRDIDCPYNTYKINGLPPGPIYIPSSAVVDAVLHRADVNYIYMCAKPDYSGLHNFAVSDAEHARNAKVFQTWLAAELKKKG
jgi:UPF0755 protein